MNGVWEAGIPWLVFLGYGFPGRGVLFAAEASRRGEAKSSGRVGHVTFAQTFAAADHGLAAERVVLTLQDGLRLGAYEVRVFDPCAVVIFLSGLHHPSVTAFFGHARMLAESGYVSLLLEMRADGESEGDFMALGFHEHRDVRAAWTPSARSPGTPMCRSWCLASPWRRSGSQRYRPYPPRLLA